MVKLNSRGSSLTRIVTTDDSDTVYRYNLGDDAAPPALPPSADPPPMQLIARGSVRQKIAIFEQRKNLNTSLEAGDVEPYFRYDLTPIADTHQKTPSSYSVDPYEFSGGREEEFEEEPLSPK